MSYVGGFAGYVHAYTDITNCYVKDSYICYESKFESAIQGHGGFIGLIRNIEGASTLTTAPVIKNCYVYNTELRTAYDRELCGFVGVMYTSCNANASFENCYVAGIKYPATNYPSADVDSGVYSTVYGFANKGNRTGIEVVNCYSSLAGGQGAYGTYTAANSLGIVGASRDAVVNAFESVSGFAASPAVNGGYPCFATEVPFEVKSVTIEGSSVTVNVARKSGVTTPATVYVATYDNEGRFVDAKASAVNEDDFTFTPDGLTLATTLKVFVWGNNNNPLTYAE